MWSPAIKGSPSKHLRWLYIVFWRARKKYESHEHLKEKKKQKQTWRLDVYRESCYTCRYRFLSRTSVHKKTPKNVLKNTLLSSSLVLAKLRSQFAALIAPTTEMEDGRDRVREGSQCVVTVYFLPSEASLWVPWAMKRLGCLQKHNWHRKNNHHWVTKRGGFHDSNPLEAATGTTGLVGYRSGEQRRND